MAKFTTNRINGITGSMRPNSTSVDIDCDMSEGQMFDALLVFLEQISDETWAEWVKQIDRDSYGGKMRTFSEVKSKLLDQYWRERGKT